MAKHADEHADLALMKSKLKGSAFRAHGGAMRAAGGGVHMDAGAASGEGRLEKASAMKRSGGLNRPGEIEGSGTVPKLAGGRKHGGRVKRRADGGGAESLSDPDADTSRMAVEEKGRSIPMSQKQMNSTGAAAAQAADYSNQSLGSGLSDNIGNMINKKRGGHVGRKRHKTT